MGLLDSCIPCGLLPYVTPLFGLHRFDYGPLVLKALGPFLTMELSSALLWLQMVRTRPGRSIYALRSGSCLILCSLALPFQPSWEIPFSSSFLLSFRVQKPSHFQRNGALHYMALVARYLPGLGTCTTWLANWNWTRTYLGLIGSQRLRPSIRSRCGLLRSRS